MADNVGFTPGSGATIKTDQGSLSGAHMQVVKLAESADGGESLVGADATYGLDVDVTRVQAVVTVAQSSPTNLRVDASGVPVPVTDNSGSLTVDAPVSTPVFVRLSDGTNALTTLPVSDGGGTLSVDDGAGSLTVDGTVAATQSGTWNIGTVASITTPVPVTDNSGSLTVDDGGGSLTVDGSVTSSQGSPAGNANAWPVKVSDGTSTAGITDVSGAKCLKVDVVQQAAPTGTVTVNASGYAVPVTDNSGSLTVDAPVGTPVFVRLSDGAAAITALPVTDNSGSLTVDGSVTANQGTANATPWNQNVAQVGGASVVSAAAGVQKVGVADESGAAFSDTNPLPVSVVTTDRTRISKAATYAANETDVAIWTPAGGKKFVVLGCIINTTGVGLIKIYDNANAAANMLFQGTPIAGTVCMLFPHPWVSGAANNVLRYSTGAAAAGDVTVYGYEV